MLISCSACQYSQFSKLEVSRSPSILCFVTKSLILGHGGQLLQAQYVVYYLKLFWTSHSFSLQCISFISYRVPEPVFIAQNVLIPFKKEEGRGQLPAQFHAKLGNPGVEAIILLSQMSQVSPVYIYLYIFSNFALIFSKTVSKPKSTSGDVPSYDNRCAFNCINTIMATLSSVTHNSEETTGFG